MTDDKPIALHAIKGGKDDDGWYAVVSRPSGEPLGDPAHVEIIFYTPEQYEALVHRAFNGHRNVGDDQLKSEQSVPLMAFMNFSLDDEARFKAFREFLESYGDDGGE